MTRADVSDAEAVEFLVPAAGGRIDRLVADATGCGRRRARLWLQQGRVLVDGRRVRAGHVPLPGQRVEVVGEPQPAAEALPAGYESVPAPVTLLVAGPTLIALNKPAAMHSHRGRGRPTAADFVESLFGDQAEVGDRPEEAGIVHRLDRDTSGVLVAARSRQAYLRLRGAFASGRTRKFYLALAEGRLRAARTIEAALAPRARRVAVAGPHDRALTARTRIEPLDGGKDWTLVLASTSTGVRHQIRAHLALAGHPLVGDLVYGGRPAPGDVRRGQLLHALRLVVPEEIDVCAPVAADFLAAYAALRRAGEPLPHVSEPS